jgi:hypothetical protein
MLFSLAGVGDTRTTDSIIGIYSWVGLVAEMQSKLHRTVGSRAPIPQDRDSAPPDHRHHLGDRAWSSGLRGSGVS